MYLSAHHATRERRRNTSHIEAMTPSGDGQAQEREGSVIDRAISKMF
jgi:hypothetical protein